jgi:hypothetical protein
MGQPTAHLRVSVMMIIMINDKLNTVIRGKIYIVTQIFKLISKLIYRLVLNRQ